MGKNSATRPFSQARLNQSIPKQVQEPRERERYVIAELLENLLIELESEQVPTELQAGYGAIAELIRPILLEVLEPKFSAFPSMLAEERLAQRRKQFLNKERMDEAVARARGLAARQHLLDEGYRS